MFGLAPLPRHLQAALADERNKKQSVRLSAVRDLARLAADPEARAEALDALCRVLAKDEAATVRAEAALALADAEGSEGVESLLDALEDAHLEVRQMAWVALGELGAESPRARDAVAGALGDDAPAIRFQALIAAHRLLGDGAASAIGDKVGDPDPLVRAMALRLAEERELHTVVPAAKRALDDEELSVRLAAAIFLARLGHRDGGKVMVSALSAPRGQLSPEDEQAAIELSAELGLKKARPALERRAFGVFGVSRDPFAWHARIALARLGHPRAKEAILKGLSAWTRDARTLAVVAAGRAHLSEAKETLAAMAKDTSRADPDAVREALALVDKGLAASESHR